MPPDENYKIRLRRIISDKHINESDKDFNKFVEGKKPATVARYRRYRKSVLTLRQKGYNVYPDGRYTLMRRTPRASKDIPSYQEIPETEVKHTYAHLFEYVCNTPSLDEKIHRHALESRRKRPNRKASFASHNKIFPDHFVLRFEYSGTWVRY